MRFPRPQPDVVIAAGDPDVPNGKKLFRQYCVACHGDTGLGSHGGAPLVNASKDINTVIITATTGRGDMPSFRDVLKPEQLRDIGGYIVKELFQEQAAITTKDVGR